VEMVIWQLPEPSAERPHGIKYRRYCGRLDGTLVVRYDNETGKGDHRHYASSETPYQFIGVDTLMSDFLADVAKAMKEEK